MSDDHDPFLHDPHLFERMVAMPDIVERLRDAAMNAPDRGGADALLLDEAATEIERLRHALARAEWARGGDPHLHAETTSVMALIVSPDGVVSPCPGCGQPRIWGEACNHCGAP